MNTEYSLEQASIWVFFQSHFQFMSNIQKWQEKERAQCLGGWLLSPTALPMVPVWTK